MTGIIPTKATKPAYKFIVMESTHLGRPCWRIARSNMGTVVWVEMTRHYMVKAEAQDEARRRNRNIIW